MIIRNRTTSKTATRSPLGRSTKVALTLQRTGGTTVGSTPGEYGNSDIDPEGVAHLWLKGTLSACFYTACPPPQVVPTYGSLKGQSDKVERLSGDGFTVLVVHMRIVIKFMFNLWQFVFEIKT